MKTTQYSNRNNPRSGLLIIHHSGASAEQTFESINTYHKDIWASSTESSLGYFCGYHYVIDKNGIVNQARLDTDEGAHTIGCNRKSLGICLIGDFDNVLPPSVQIDALTKLMLDKLVLWGIPLDNILPHRHFAKKTCYGSMLADTWAQDLIVHYKGGKFGTVSDLSQNECPV